MLDLSRKQLKFLETEFGLAKSHLSKISKEEWHSIREKSFFISVGELLDDEGQAVDFVTERCRIAESIADLKYSELMG